MCNKNAHPVLCIQSFLQVQFPNLNTFVKHEYDMKPLRYKGSLIFIEIKTRNTNKELKTFPLSTQE